MPPVYCKQVFRLALYLGDLLLVVSLPLRQGVYLLPPLLAAALKPIVFGFQLCVPLLEQLILPPEGGDVILKPALLFGAARRKQRRAARQRAD